MERIRRIEDIGYRVEKGRVKNERNGEDFLIIDRKFQGINKWFRNIPERIITEYTKHSNESVTILDVGGGGHSKSAQGIAEKFGEKIRAVNIDLLADKAGAIQSVLPIKGNMFRMPFADQSFDLVTSYQTIPHLLDASQRVPVVLKEISRVLKDGGTALIHEDYYSYPEYFNSSLPPDNFAANITIKEAILNLSRKQRLEKFLCPERYYPGRFLIMQRGEVYPWIKKVINKVPDKIP